MASCLVISLPNSFTGVCRSLSESPVIAFCDSHKRKRIGGRHTIKQAGHEVRNKKRANQAYAGGVRAGDAVSRRIAHLLGRARCILRPWRVTILRLICSISLPLPIFDRPGISRSDGIRGGKKRLLAPRPRISRFCWILARCGATGAT